MTPVSHGARLRFAAVEKSFGAAPIRADGLTVEPGSLTVLLGRSGCGKTTLLNLAAGLETPGRGTVLYDEVPLAGPAPRSVFIFQHHNLFPWMTAEGNISFALRNLGFAESEARGRARELLEKVGLLEFAAHVPRQLSGGMRQRVALARSIAVEPRLLLLDEPFSALDAQTRRLMQRYLLDAWRATGASVLMVTHDLGEALMLADRIVLMGSDPSGYIAEYIDIDLKHPRDVEHPRFRELQRHIDTFLETEARSAEHSAR